MPRLRRLLPSAPVVLLAGIAVIVFALTRADSLLLAAALTVLIFAILTPRPRRVMVRTAPTPPPTDDQPRMEASIPTNRLCPRCRRLSLTSQVMLDDQWRVIVELVGCPLCRTGIHAPTEPAAPGR